MTFHMRGGCSLARGFSHHPPNLANLLCCWKGDLSDYLIIPILSPNARNMDVSKQPGIKQIWQPCRDVSKQAGIKRIWQPCRVAVFITIFIYMDHDCFVICALSRLCFNIAPRTSSIARSIKIGRRTVLFYQLCHRSPLPILIAISYFFEKNRISNFFLGILLAFVAK